MEEYEAKVILESEYKFHGECSVFGEALTVAIQALEKQIELKKYIEECKSCGNGSAVEFYEKFLVK